MSEDQGPDPELASQVEGPRILSDVRGDRIVKRVDVKRMVILEDTAPPHDEQVAVGQSTGDIAEIEEVHRCCRVGPGSVLGVQADYGQLSAQLAHPGMHDA